MCLDVSITYAAGFLKFCFKTCVAMKFVDDDDEQYRAVRHLSCASMASHWKQLRFSCDDWRQNVSILMNITRHCCGGLVMLSLSTNVLTSWPFLLYSVKWDHGLDLRFIGLKNNTHNRIILAIRHILLGRLNQLYTLRPIKMISLNILYWRGQTCTEFNVIERA